MLKAMHTMLYSEMLGRDSIRGKAYDNIRRFVGLLAQVQRATMLLSCNGCLVFPHNNHARRASKSFFDGNTDGVAYPFTQTDLEPKA